MAEVLGTVASILQGLDTASKTWEHIQDFRNAPQEEKQIRIEMEYLQVTLKRLHQQIHRQTTPIPVVLQINPNPFGLQINPNAFGPQINPNPSSPQTPPNPSSKWLQDMDKPLADFDGLMKEFTQKLGDLNTVTTFKRQVKWSLGGKKEAVDYLAKFEQFKSLLNMWLLVDLGDMSRDQSDRLESVKSKVAKLELGVNNLNNNKQDASERTQIIDWFSPINFFQQHADITSAWQKGTGGWLLANPHFQEWKKGLGKTLWCSGIPGAGKTVLASMVVDHLSQGPTARTACIYLNHKETKVQTPANLLASIWRQLVIGGRDISAVRTLYGKHLEKKTRPSLAEIENTVHNEIGMSKVYIVVDAVDEYPEELRQILLPALAAMGPTCNLMMTSRPHITSSSAFQNIKFLEIHADMDDIQAYVNMEINKSPHLSKFVQKQPTLMGEIHARISGKVDGMFLLAKLHMKVLAEQRTPKKVWTALDNLPKTLADTYADAMRRIDTQSEGDKQIAQAVLTWVTHAKEVLSVEDLRVALAIEPGTKELDDDDLLDIETILGVCAGLIIVDEHLSVLPRRQCRHTPFFHRPVLTWSTKLKSSGPAHADFHVDCSLAVLSCANRFMTAPGLSSLPSHALSLSRQFLPASSLSLWLGFAQRFWDQWSWLRRPEEQFPLLVAATANLLDIAGVLIEQGQYSKDMEEELVEASARGHYDMVKLLANSGANLNAQGGLYGNALQAAALEGSKEVVQLLIDHGADVNAQGGECGNALQAAALEGSKEVVQLLIEHGADLNAQGGECGNALQAAAVEGSKEVVQLLIEHRANVNAQGGKCGNALQAAAVEGSKEVVQLLIEHGANVNAQGGKCGNALLAAACMGHKEVVQLLIEHRAEVNAQVGEYYGNALQAAALYGHKEVVQLLIEHGADVNAQGGYFGNALQAAAQGGHKELVQLLIEHGANVNAQGGEFGNALQAAARWGHKEVVQLLIEHGADVNAQGGEYGNALQAAAVEGSKEVVQLLIDHGADVNAQGGECGNALQAAALEGSKEVVQLLIEHRANVNAQGGKCGNALQAAAVEGSKEVVQLLIEHGADVNAQVGEYAYSTALQAAAHMGSKELVQLLIDHGADVNAEGGEFGNALQAAARRGHKEVVQLLIDHGANVNAQGGLYGNALQAAAQRGHKELVQLLIEHGADVNAQGGEFGNALQAAARWGHKEVVQLLIEHGADVNAQGGEYGNALQAAAVEGSREVVQLLIEHGADVNAQVGEYAYSTALQAAAHMGSKELVQLLIDHGADVNAEGGEFGNALQAAARRGHKEVVQLLIDHGANVNAQEVTGVGTIMLINKEICTNINDGKQTLPQCSTSNPPAAIASVTEALWLLPPRRLPLLQQQHRRPLAPQSIRVLSHSAAEPAQIRT
ncbi:ankyrin repeat-containing domain protein [Mycena filopes]|nr:ankyrin repeat-containing domain protein [Mycena filopes]